MYVRVVSVGLVALAFLLVTGCKKAESVAKPTSMTINEIEVIRYQEFNNGAKWDATDGPDLTIGLKKGSNVVWTSIIFIENPVFLNVQSFSMQPPYTLDSPTGQYTLTLYDDDGPSNKEFMGEILFTPWDGTANKPAVLSLDNGGDVAFKIYVTYNY